MTKKADIQVLQDNEHLPIGITYYRPLRPTLKMAGKYSMFVDQNDFGPVLHVDDSPGICHKVYLDFVDILFVLVRDKWITLIVKEINDENQVA